MKDTRAEITYIADEIELQNFCIRSAGTEVLAIDTEFMREKTYYPNLCLLQLATVEETVIVDPFTVHDLSALCDIIEDDQTVKLFHAASQDLEILYRELGVLPTRIFDVQSAAAILGQTQQAGLASIISSFLGINIKKSDSFTDWSRRPLAESQIIYAAEDVLYLPALYKKMMRQLDDLGRAHWLDDEFASMCDSSKYEEDPYLRYKRLKRGNQLNRKQAAAARVVTAWRELQAQKRDIPRKWILTDEQIVESCKREPKSIDELFMVRGIKNSLSTRDAREVVKLMREAWAQDPETWPKPEVGSTAERNVDAAVDLMSALVRKRAHDENIAMQTLASHSDLVDFARGHLEGNPLASGWRSQILGDDMKALLAGDLALKLDGDELTLIDCRK